MSGIGQGDPVQCKMQDMSEDADDVRVRNTYIAMAIGDGGQNRISHTDCHS